MLHLRLFCPADRTDDVLGLLTANPGAFNVMVLPGAALAPAGDVVMCDVARESVNHVITGLRDLGVHRDGSIAAEHIDVSISDVALAADLQAPGEGGDAAVWEEVDARVRDESRMTASFLVFLVIAALIAIVGVIEDAPILIVGAMVVGPEFGPIAGLSVGLFKRRGHRIRQAGTTLAAGLAAGVVAAFLGTLVLDAVDLIPPDLVPHDQPLTGFIVDPSVLSLVVALLAGVTGTLSLTQAKSGALIGVLISVTTIPAVAAIGVSSALGKWSDAGGAAVQLAVNVGALVAAGVVTLWVQWVAWNRIAPSRPTTAPHQLWRT